MSTPESPIVTESETVKTEESKEKTSPETISTPEENHKRDIEILDGVNTLCNTTLYCLTKGFYPGADAHLVDQAKNFIKEIKKDVEAKRKLVSDGKAVNLG